MVPADAPAILAVAFTAFLVCITTVLLGYGLRADSPSAVAMARRTETPGKALPDQTMGHGAGGGWGPD